MAQFRSPSIGQQAVHVIAVHAPALPHLVPSVVPNTDTAPSPQHSVLMALLRAHHGPLSLSHHYFIKGAVAGVIHGPRQVKF